MGLLTRFRQKKHAPEDNLTDEDRQTSLEIRRINAEKKKILAELGRERAIIEAELETRQMRAELEDLKADLEPEEEEGGNALLGGFGTETPENLLMMNLLKIMQSPNQQQNPPMGSSYPVNEDSMRLHSAGTPQMERAYSDSQLMEFAQNIPSQYKSAIAEIPAGDLIRLKELLSSQNMAR